MTSSISYTGELRTNCTHERSGNSIITDAPVDNHGKGEAFSPTDLVATALGSCMLTVMGIRAGKSDIRFDDAKAEITKHMGDGPRRIVKVEVAIYLSDRYDEKERRILEHAANTCPVLYSLHNDIEKDVTFVYQ